MASPKKKKENKYSISLLFGGKKYESTGETPVEALSTLPSPGKIMLRGVVTISDGTNKKELLLSPVQVRRLYITSDGLKAAKAKVLFMGLK